MNDCLPCERIALIKLDQNPYFVKEFETSYLVLADHQRYRGTCIFICKQHISELHLLTKKFKIKFLSEMSIAAELVFTTFTPKKLNLELLGNTDAHLHWWIIPRYESDSQPKLPIWSTDLKETFSDKYLARPRQLKYLKSQLLQSI